jgi:hypothetical protein
VKNFITPDWPAADNIRAFCSTRIPGVSEGRYAGFNLSNHVNDAPQRVAQNRAELKQSLNLPAEPVWLEQVHGKRVVDASHGTTAQADAAFSCAVNTVCAVMTADCLPVLICNRQGSKVAAVHAGWRGLLAGVIENTLAAMQQNPSDCLLWLGPAIGSQAFEVGAEVRQAFVDEIPATAAAFIDHKPGHWLADIYQLARIRLRKKGLHAIYGGGLCTYTDATRFYSYRRDGETGRMASLIWRET